MSSLCVVDSWGSPRGHHKARSEACARLGPPASTLVVRLHSGKQGMALTCSWSGLTVEHVLYTQGETWKSVLHSSVSELRMQEMVSMGLGSKPFQDIKASDTAISDRAVKYIMKGTGGVTTALASLCPAGALGTTTAGGTGGGPMVLATSTG